MMSESKISNMNVEDDISQFLLYRRGKKFVCDNPTLQTIFPDIIFNKGIAKKRLAKLLAKFECQCFKQDFSNQHIIRLSNLLDDEETIAIALIKINDTFGSAVLEHSDRNEEGIKQYWIHEVCKSGISNRTTEDEILHAKTRDCPYPKEFVPATQSPIPFIFEMFKHYIIQTGGNSSWLYVDNTQPQHAIEALVNLYSKKYNYKVKQINKHFISMKTEYPVYTITDHPMGEGKKSKKTPKQKKSKKTPKHKKSTPKKSKKSRPRQKKHRKKTQSKK